MKPAVRSRRRFGDTKLLLLGDDAVRHARFGELAERLDPGDLVVVNRSGTLPSSFRGHVEKSREEIEIRLAAFQGPHPGDLTEWLAVSFGAGDWRRRTEDRGPPPRLEVGEVLHFAGGLSARILGVQDERLLRVRFEASGKPEASSGVAAPGVGALYRAGRPIQYSYLEEEIAVWDQQTLFSGAPISVEAPSAGFAFDWELWRRLRARGVNFATVLHGAGLSSTGSAALDRRLPLAEWSEVPDVTIQAIEAARRAGRRVVALGTTVLRALESAWVPGEGLRPRAGLTTLRISPAHTIRSVTHLVTGMHDLGESHRDIVHAIVSPELAAAADAQAEARGYFSHEYGDLALVGPVKG